ncbi:MAG: extracellular solute-binding protein [Acetobacteraceae bacterium]|nr:extracellular solute-binding protein [Acetobacteraceae bacterium]
MPLTRRHLLSGGAALAAASLDAARTWAAEQPFTPEKGASLPLLRRATFLPAEGATTAANVAAFTEATGVRVTVENVNQDDFISKAALAVQIGSRPDIICTQNTTAHLFPTKLVDVTDLATYLGGKYGGWYPVCENYGKEGDRWIRPGGHVCRRGLRRVQPEGRDAAGTKAGGARLQTLTTGFLPRPGRRTPARCAPGARGPDRLHLTRTRTRTRPRSADRPGIAGTRRRGRP